MLKCLDHAKVGTLLYRRAKRGSLVGAAHIHMVILYSARSDILEGECIKGLGLPKVYVDVKNNACRGAGCTPRNRPPYWGEMDQKCYNSIREEDAAEQRECNSLHSIYTEGSTQQTHKAICIRNWRDWEHSEYICN